MNMPVDRSFVQLNRAATERIRRLVKGLSDEQLLYPVGDMWTVGICLAHLAFWDRRVMYVMDMTADDGQLFVPEIDIFVNDLSLPLWAAIPGREAARISIETADACDKRLEAFPEPMLEKMHDYNKRWVFRALHRNEHLDEVDAALKSQPSAN
jgi:hypothetical protein